MKKAILLLFPLFLSACTQTNETHTAHTSPDMNSESHKDPNSLYRLGESLKHAGNFETAANMYQQVLNLDPEFHSARVNYSECMRYTGRPEMALQALKSTPEDSRNAHWYKELGSVETSSQNPKACIAAYKSALQSAPNDVDALNGIAVCNDLMGQHEMAQNWYQQAINLDPANSRLKSNYGLSLALSKHPAKAIEILIPIVQGPDATSKDRHNLAIAYGLNGDLETATQYFSQDMDQSGIRTNLAFIHKLAQSQSINPIKPSSFESNLSSDISTASSPTIEIKEIPHVGSATDDRIQVPEKKAMALKAISAKKAPTKKKAKNANAVKKK